MTRSCPMLTLSVCCGTSEALAVQQQTEAALRQRLDEAEQALAEAADVSAHHHERELQSVRKAAARAKARAVERADNSEVEVEVRAVCAPWRCMAPSFVTTALRCAPPCVWACRS